MRSPHYPIGTLKVMIIFSGLTNSNQSPHRRLHVFRQGRSICLLKENDLRNPGSFDVMKELLRCDQLKSIGVKRILRAVFPSSGLFRDLVGDRNGKLRDVIFLRHESQNAVCSKERRIRRIRKAVTVDLRQYGINMILEIPLRPISGNLLCATATPNIASWPYSSQKHLRRDNDLDHTFDIGVT